MESDQPDRDYAPGRRGEGGINPGVDPSGQGETGLSNLSKTRFEIEFVWHPTEKLKRKPLEEIEEAIAKAGGMRDPKDPNWINPGALEPPAAAPNAAAPAGALDPGATGLGPVPTPPGQTVPGAP